MSTSVASQTVLQIGAKASGFEADRRQFRAKACPDTQSAARDFRRFGPTSGRPNLAPAELGQKVARSHRDRISERMAEVLLHRTQGIVHHPIREMAAINDVE
jgi:hypothetical protein